MLSVIEQQQLGNPLYSKYVIDIIVADSQQLKKRPFQQNKLLQFSNILRISFVGRRLPPRGYEGDLILERRSCVDEDVILFEKAPHILIVELSLLIYSCIGKMEDKMNIVCLLICLQLVRCGKRQ